MSTQNITVRGQNVTASTFTNDFKTVKSAAAKLGMLLEAAGKQGAIYDNLDWINRLFAPESPLVKQNGDLTEQGKKGKAYIMHHVPCLKIEQDKESGVFKASYTKNKKLRGQFLTDVVEGENIMSADASADFYFSFEGWVNKAKKPTAPKAPKASKLSSTMEKTLDDWEKLEGNIEDFAALEQMARRMMEAANARKSNLVAEAGQTIDTDKAFQAGTAKPQSSKRADTDREAASEEESNAA